MYLKVAKLSYIILGDFLNCQISCSIGMLIGCLVKYIICHPDLFVKSNRKTARCYQHQTASIDFSYQDLPERYIRLDTWIISSPERSGKGRIFYTLFP